MSTQTAPLLFVSNEGVAERQTALATKIIDLAKAGERNPDILCEQVLKDIRTPRV